MANRFQGPDKKNRFQGPAKQPSVQEAYEALPWYGKAAQAADDVVRGIANGVTLGYADQFAGYMNGTGADAERAKTEEARERGGSAITAAEITGTMFPATRLAKLVQGAGLAGVGLGTRTLSAAGQAGLLGTAQRMGNGQEVTPTGVATDMAIGAGGNVLGEGLSAGVSKFAGLFNKSPKTMTAEELKATGQAAYRRADDAGVIYKPEAIDRLRQGVYDEFADFGFHPKNQPGAAVGYDELARLVEGGNVSMKGLDTARKVAQGGINPTNPSNNALIGKLTGKIDDFAANAGPDDVLTGNSQAASEALGEGRDYWGRFRKLEKVQELLDRAGLNAGSTGSGGNIENATRQQLKRVLTDKKMMRGFTADEKAAISKAVLGTPAQNALRLAGKLSPQGNGLMLAAGSATSVASPMIGLPLMAAGYGAKKLAEGMTAKNAAAVKKLIAAGGSKSAITPAPNAVQRLAQSKKDALVRLLTSSGLVLRGR